MTAISKRKLTVHGGSVGVTLPRGWLREKGLEPRDLVEVIEGDSVILIRPPAPKRRPIT